MNDIIERTASLAAPVLLRRGVRFGESELQPPRAVLQLRLASPPSLSIKSAGISSAVREREIENAHLRGIPVRDFPLALTQHW